MTTPPPAPTRRYLSLGFNQGEATSKWRRLDVSHADGPIKWLTIPWDVDYADPDSMHFDAGGWTVLHGPCDFELWGYARLKQGQPGCSTHIQLYTVDAAEQVLHRYEAWETFVGPKESSHTHVNGSWPGRLDDGVRLRVNVDYWNASTYCYLVGATLSGFYWPIGD